MSAPSFIRRHINKFVGDKPFSIRDCLKYGSRDVVDQTFKRLVRQGCILRVARGVYVKSSAPAPSLIEIVQCKATAFGRIIATHGGQAAAKLNGQFKGEDKLVFATSGATTCFNVGHKTVRLIHASDRKMQLGDRPAGLTIRALWHLGKYLCDVETAALMVFYFNQDDRKELRISASLMPQWMRECFAQFARMECNRFDVEPLPIR
jgi:hypothetical protein